MIKKVNVVLIAILLLASILRLYRLTSLPALNADEAAIGYNAYSLLLTGKDEHGTAWPVHFQSFNDYKPGLYFYTVLPFVKIIGLNELAVRLPGALLGIATVFFVWLVARELFPKIKWLPELSSLFLAISPWHLHFSRGGWEVNAATFFITAGVWAFLKAIKESKYFYFAVIAFVASVYTYHASRVVVPLLLIGFAVIYRKILIAKKREIIISLALGFVLLIPLARDFLGPAGISRAAGVGLFADTGPFWRINQQRGEHADLRSPLTLIYHNKPINYGLAFLQNYASYFSGEFLFIDGDMIQRDKVPDMGQMYLFDFLFISLGLFEIARNFRRWSVVILWLLIAPVAAALTFQSPHALRAENMIIPLVIISAYGVLVLAGWLQGLVKDKNLLTIFYFLFTMFIFWGFVRYLHQYYNHMSQTYDFSSQYGVKEVVKYVSQDENKYSKVLITTAYDQPYIQYLFYSKYSPQDFQRDHNLTSRDKFGFSTVESFGKYVFKSIDSWDQVKKDYPNSLIAGTDKEIPEAANVLDTIYFPSGRVAFRIVAN